MSEPWESIEGWFDVHHQKEYGSLLRRIPNGSTVVEVGCFRGRSLCSVAPVIKEMFLKVVVVDLFDYVGPYYPYDEPGVIPRAPGMLSDFVSNVRTFGILEGMSIHVMSSIKASLTLRVRPHLVFIDGAHDYASVKSDIESWADLIPSRGIICGHDYAEYSPGVIQAVNEMFPRATVKDGIWSQIL